VFVDTQPVHIICQFVASIPVEIHVICFLKEAAEALFVIFISKYQKIVQVVHDEKLTQTTHQVVVAAVVNFHKTSILYFFPDTTGKTQLLTTAVAVVLTVTVVEIKYLVGHHADHHSRSTGQELFCHRNLLATLSYQISPFCLPDGADENIGAISLSRASNT
jgi:hypothetical protein